MHTDGLGSGRAWFTARAEPSQATLDATVAKAPSVCICVHWVPILASARWHRHLMPRHVVATVDEIAPGTCKIVAVSGREIGIFNVHGEFHALVNRCPHEGRRAVPRPDPRAIHRRSSRRISPDPAWRNAALSLARLGIRHQDRPVLVPPGKRQGPHLSVWKSCRAKPWRKARSWPRRCRSALNSSMSW